MNFVMCGDILYIDISKDEEFLAQNVCQVSLDEHVLKDNF